MKAAAQATKDTKKASEEAGKAAQQNANELAKTAKAHQDAAKAVGLQYDKTGQLVTMNGKAVSSQQAAAHGLQSFSKEAYLAGKAADDAARLTRSSFDKMSDSISRNQEQWGQVGAISAGAGLAMVAGVGLAIKTYADFDKQMSSVDAATHETKGNMDLLRQAAIDAGADTAFSAGEAAQGIEELAKAGVSTKDILGGGLNGALSLAAAGAIGVGDAAEIAASALTQFKLSGDQVPHIADLLAAGAGKAQGSVEDLGAALNQSGLVASSTGLTIEETTGSLAAFASAGLTGSDAGTSFKTMLMSLNPNSKEAAQLMDELGIHAYDAQGKFVGMSEYAGILQNALKGMSDEQRNATLKTLFGSDAVRAANVLYEQGADGINKWESAVNDAGYAAETAARMQDNLAGDLEKLGGSFDTVLLQSGSGANDVLRGMVQNLEGVVDAVGKVPGPVLGAATGFAGLLGGAALLGGGLITVIPKIRDTKEALEVLAPAGSKANAALSRTGKIAAGAATGLAAIAAAATVAGPAMDKILAPTGDTADALEKFAGQAAQGAVGADTLSTSFQDLVQHQDGISDFQQALNGIADPGIWGNIDNIATDTIGVLSLGMVNVKSTTEEARSRFEAMGEQLASLDPSKASESFQSMAEHTDGSAESLSRLLDYMPGYRDKLEEQAKSAKLATDDQTLLDIAMGKVQTSTEGASGAVDGLATSTDAAKGPTEEVAKALEEIGVSADGTVTNLVKFTDALLNAGLLQLSARDAARNFQAAIDAVSDSVAKNGTSLDINTEQGRNNQAALDAVASAGLNVVKANAANGESQKTLQGNLKTTYNNLVTSAGQFGITGGKADELARKVMGIPPKANINSWMSDAAKRMAEQTAGAMNAINGKTVNTYVNHHETTFINTVRSDSVQSGKGTANRGPTAFAVGGRIKGYADGGQLPTSGPGTDVTDGFLGVTSMGMPIARVDAGEWIINPRSSDRYNRELAAINAGTFPKLPGYANGGREYAFGSTARGVLSGATEIHNHYHVDAKPGLAYEYAKDIARQTVTRTQDMQAAYGS
jgi:TP901 family phage tail tape measure protein